VATGNDIDYLYCACSHLTDFSSIRFPTTFNAFLADLASITFNTFTATDVLNFFTSFDASTNPSATYLVVSMNMCWFVTMAFAMFRLHRRALNRTRRARHGRERRRMDAMLKLEKKKVRVSLSRSLARSFLHSPSLSIYLYRRRYIDIDRLID